MPELGHDIRSRITEFQVVTTAHNTSAISHIIALDEDGNLWTTINDTFTRLIPMRKELA